MKARVMYTLVVDVCFMPSSLSSFTHLCSLHTASSLFYNAIPFLLCYCRS